MYVTTYLARSQPQCITPTTDAAYGDGGIDNLDVSFFDQDFSCLEAELLDFFFGYLFATLELSDLATWGQRSERGEEENWEEDRSRSLGMTECSCFGNSRELPG